MEFLVLMVVGGLMGWLTATMAEKRHRSYGGWFVGGFMFGLLAVILLACLGSLEKKEATQ